MLKVTGPQLKMLAQILTRLDKSGVVPEYIRNSEDGNESVLIPLTSEYFEITKSGHTTISKY